MDLSLGSLFLMTHAPYRKFSPSYIFPTDFCTSLCHSHLQLNTPSNWIYSLLPRLCPSSSSLEGEKKKTSTVAYTRYQIRMLSLLSKHSFLVILKPICLFILTVTSTALAQTLLRTFIKSPVTHLTPPQLLIIMPQRDLPQTQIQVYYLFFKILQKA